MSGKRMTNRELVDAAIKLAGDFYSMMGYTHRPGFKYWESPHPQEQLVFQMACRAFEVIRGSDVMLRSGEFSKLPVRVSFCPFCGESLKTWENRNE